MTKMNKSVSSIEQKISERKWLGVWNYESYTDKAFTMTYLDESIFVQCRMKNFPSSCVTVYLFFRCFMVVALHASFKWCRSFLYGCIILVVKDTSHFSFWIIVVIDFPVSKTIYTITDHKAEKWIETSKLIMLKVSPICLMAPQFSISFYVYFTTGLGNDAFELAFPAW